MTGETKNLFTEKTIRLNNGVEMPLEGFGVYQVAEDICQQTVCDAVETGSSRPCWIREKSAK